MLGSILLATAGHVDHGKSSLVEALTGIHPDRLPQERARGMTLDLGFAHIDGISIIDVPGHQDYLRHMISGVADADGVILMISAHEGVQEQTLEHLRILKFLNHDRVLFVVSKIDLVEPGRLKQVLDEVCKLRKEISFSEVFLWSTHRKAELMPAFLDTIKTFFIQSKKPIDSGRFFPDRCFSLKGIGTVVTGTLLGSTVSADQLVLIFNPYGKTENQTWRQARVRALQTAGQSVGSLAGKRRVSLALSGIEPTALPRGSMVFLKNKIPPLFKQFEAQVQWANGAKASEVGKKFGVIAQTRTFQAEAMLIRAAEGPCKLIFKQPLPLFADDLFVLRVLTRQKDFGQTIACATILRPFMKKQKVKNTLPQSSAPHHNAQAVSRTEKQYRVQDGWYLSREEVLAITEWLRRFHENRRSITIDDAREYFGSKMGRKKIIALLEFCDRHYWTFRKENERFTFRLPTN